MTHLDAIVKKLNSHFFKSLVRFNVVENRPIPTVLIVLKHDKYVREDQLCFKDNFRPELLDVLKECGIEKVEFNNTGTSFWFNL